MNVLAKVSTFLTKDSHRTCVSSIDKKLCVRILFFYESYIFYWSQTLYRRNWNFFLWTLFTLWCTCFNFTDHIAKFKTDMQFCECLTIVAILTNAISICILPQRERFPFFDFEPVLRISIYTCNYCC